MLFKIEPRLTKEYLLSKNSQEVYLQYYLNIPVKKGLFRSPFRKDKHPTCGFYTNKHGDIIFKDFSGQFYGNFIEVVKKKYNVGYYEALEIIANDFGYTNNPKFKKNPKPIDFNVHPFIDNHHTVIQVEIKDFTDAELKWWEQYGITLQILKKFFVFFVFLFCQWSSLTIREIIRFVLVNVKHWLS